MSARCDRSKDAHTTGRSMDELSEIERVRACGCKLSMVAGSLHACSVCVDADPYGHLSTMLPIDISLVSETLIQCLVVVRFKVDHGWHVLWLHSIIR
jgi:hypothetical protein